MKINVTKIKRAVGRTFDFQFIEEFEPIQIKGEELFFSKPVRVQVAVTNTGRILQVKGCIDTEVKLKCSRCLEGFTNELKVDLEENFIPSSEVAKDQGEGWDDEDVTLLVGEELDLREKVMENIVLSLPMKFLCDLNCKGICPQCGTNLNRESCECKVLDIDPRLQALQKLLKSE